MYPQALGYLGIRANGLEDWASYGPRFAGMQLVEQTRRSLALRMDDRKQRIVVDGQGGQGIAFIGWEVANAVALDAFAAHLDRLGVGVEKPSRAIADERRVTELIALTDPV